MCVGKRDPHCVVSISTFQIPVVRIVTRAATMALMDELLGYGFSNAGYIRCYWFPASVSYAKKNEGRLVRCDGEGNMPGEGSWRYRNSTAWILDFLDDIVR